MLDINPFKITEAHRWTDSKKNDSLFRKEQPPCSANVIVYKFSL